jgi:hypothetical protein
MRLVGALHGLRAALGIDDREPTMTEADMAGDRNPFAVRPAVRNRTRHAAYVLGPHRPSPDDPHYPAHTRSPRVLFLVVRAAARAAVLEEHSKEHASAKRAAAAASAHAKRFKLRNICKENRILSPYDGS